MGIDRTDPMHDATAGKDDARRLFRRRRTRLLAAASGVILAGLSLRTWGYDLGLSFFVVKYGGSVLPVTIPGRLFPLEVRKSVTAR